MRRGWFVTFDNTNDRIAALAFAAPRIRTHGFYAAPADARRQRRAMARKAAKEAARKGKGGNHA